MKDIKETPEAPRVQFTSPSTSTVNGQSSIAALANPYSGNHGSSEI